MRNWKTTAGGIMSIILVLIYGISNLLDIDIGAVHESKGNYLMLGAILTGAISQIAAKDYDK